MAHPHAQRLAYALDIDFKDCFNAREVNKKAAIELESSLETLHDLNIVIKGNTLFRVLGAVAFGVIEAQGFGIFADYKLFDVQSTVGNDASWIRLFSGIKILTVSEDVHPEVFTNLASTLRDVLIAPVNPLTDLQDAQFKRRGEEGRADAVGAFFARVAELPSRGIICAPSDMRYAPSGFAIGRTIITPGIRPTWSRVEGDTNAANALTPREAILAGSDCLVVGSPLRHKDDLRGNTLRVLDEIGEAVEERLHL